MIGRKLDAFIILCCAASLCGSSALGCGATHDRNVVDGGVVISEDAAIGEDASTPAPIDASMTIDAGWVGALDAAAPGVDAGPPVVVPEDAGTTPVDPGPDPHFVVDMTYVTANIGRTYDTRAEVAGVFDDIGDVIGPRSGPRLLGWQEIGEGDPCGADCEIEALRARFAADGGWETLRPSGTRPDGGTERVKVPVTSKGAGASSVRAVFASPGWAGVSPTRFVTVAYHAERNLSFINTHFIAGAWSCRSEVARRRDYWRRAWGVLQDQVAREHDHGRNVIVTGDLNRPRATNSCNPAWDPTSLHPSSRVIGGTGIDYIFAVPAAGWSFAYARRADGSVQRGTIRMAIDGHDAHWVSGHFSRP